MLEGDIECVRKKENVKEKRFVKEKGERMFRQSERLRLRESENYSTRLGRGENEEGRWWGGSGKGERTTSSPLGQGEKGRKGERAHTTTPRRDKTKTGRVMEE